MNQMTPYSKWQISWISSSWDVAEVSHEVRRGQSGERRLYRMRDVSNFIEYTRNKIYVEKTALESSDTWWYENVDESAWETELILIVLFKIYYHSWRSPIVFWETFPHDTFRSESVKFTFHTWWYRIKITCFHWIHCGSRTLLSWFRHTLRAVEFVCTEFARSGDNTSDEFDSFLLRLRKTQTSKFWKTQIILIDWGWEYKTSWSVFFSIWFFFTSCIVIV